MSISREELSLIEKIASRVARGQSAQQIAIDANLEISFVEHVLTLPAFEQTFQTLDPTAFRKWKDNQADLKSKRQAMTLAQEDAVEHYKMARDIIRGSKELKDKEKLDGLLQLLKIAKVGEGDTQREVVELSDDNMATIIEALNEVEKNK